MEFFFLIENPSREVYLFFGLFLCIVGMVGYTLWGKIRYIYNVLSSGVSPSQGINEGSTMNTTLKSDTPEIQEVILENQVNQIPEPIDSPEEANKNEDLVEEKPHKTIYENNDTEVLIGLVSSTRTLIARGMLVEARAIIIQGLALEKSHRELNLALGQIYEQEGAYEKAEYVYKDLAHLHPEDMEILEKLANVLIVEKKYIIAYEIYKKIYNSTGNTEQTLYMLTHISNTLGEFVALENYAKQYILQWPKNPEILQILLSAQIELGKRKDAIETCKNLKNITPYNTEIHETLQKLLVEEELAHNFGN